MNRILTVKAIDATDRILNTVERNVNTVIRDVEDISTYVIFSDDFRALMTLSDVEPNKPRLRQSAERITGFVLFHLLSKEYINSVMIEGTNGITMQFGEPVRGDETRWEKAADQAGGAIRWSNGYALTSDWGGRRQVISLFRVINDINDINRPIGMVRIRLNERSFYRLINVGVAPEVGSAFVLDRDGNVVSHRDVGLLGKPYPDTRLVARILGDPATSVFRYSQNQEEYLVVTREVKDTPWILVAIVNQRQVLRDLMGLRISMGIAMGLLMLLGILAFVGFYFSIIRPILELTEETRKVEKGDFKARVPVRSGDEIGTLGLRFNRMVGEIERLIDTQYRLAINQRESELKSLQNQMNPHFLYNTLDMIRWTARMEQAMETSHLIELLSRFFRLSLSQGKWWIPLEKEVQHVKTYLELQKKRLGDALKYSIFIDEEIRQAFVLKQIIQPLAENCIVHGFKEKRENCRIQVRIYRSGDDRLWIDVIDNGTGVDAAKMNRALWDENGAGFALRNIHERLAAAFGHGYGLEFLPVPDEGTWVRIKLPVLFSEEEVHHMMARVGNPDEDDED
ncbi:MAG: sensor histidine kinase [Hydrogenibacillus sp.]|nr:sensor histidine kinase [Hydrogenibacillus sp.]